MSTALPRPGGGSFDGREKEAAWVAAAKAGYAPAFEELVRRNEQKILRLAMQITRNREDAEDVAQETFIKAYKRLQQLRSDVRFCSWLASIAVNEAIESRRRHRPGHVPLDEPPETEKELPAGGLEDGSDNPERSYAQAELQQIVFRAAGKLEPDFRVVFWLRDIEDFSSEETAQLLHLPVPTMKSRLLRARLKLREELAGMLRPV